MKKSDSKFIGIREIVVVTLFSVLMFVVSMLTAMPFAASVHLQLYVGYALMAIISGPIYVLMISKAPKIRTIINECKAAFLSGRIRIISSMPRPYLTKFF